MLERLQDHLKNMYMYALLFINFPSACIGYVQFIMYLYYKNIQILLSELDGYCR